ncbi:NAD(P)-binding protein [Hypoxylon sp. NC0597]|nr:NAD(P)-binding protein [Hypoxylon sp. NC0597]
MNEDSRTAGELADLYASQIKGGIVLATSVSPGGIGAAFVLGITSDAVSAAGVEVRTLEINLASLSAVRAAAEKVNIWDDVPRIDISLAEKLGLKHNLPPFGAHPGLVVSNLAGHLKLFADDDSDMVLLLANVYVYGAFHPEIAAHNGAYLVPYRSASPWKDTVRPWATSSVEAERLWKLSEKLISREFPY